MHTEPAPERVIQKIYPVRILLFLLCVILVATLLNTVYQGIQTLDRLEVVERERDHWQRPSEVIQMLNLREGNVVADLGAGAGYFAIKLSSAVGKNGKVLAVDIRRLPLAFLWVRALLRNQYNVRVIHSDAESSHLPAGAVDAVLVANTYHELTHPKSVIDSTFQSLRRGGRLVILDRGPKSADGESRQSGMQQHEMPLGLAESEIRQSGFQIVNRQDHFIDGPGEAGLWWLLVASKP